jgi:hypothetical protein
MLGWWAGGLALSLWLRLSRSLSPCSPRANITKLAIAYPYYKQEEAAVAVAIQTLTLTLTLTLHYQHRRTSDLDAS